ncbi:MAG: YjbQ family protein [Candidatus Omnitrophica bacterium]|nr:YjbQ family protein [Candidatus Omnitrophota bacterium]
MPVITKRIHVSTKANTDIVDLTPQVREIVNNSPLKDGQATVFAPGATAGVSTVEFEPGLLQDIPERLEAIAPSRESYHHDMTWHDGNGHSHVRATFIGPSLTVPFVDKTLTLGTWQQIILIDCDVPARQRDIVVQLIGE